MEGKNLVVQWDFIEKHVNKKKGSNGKWIMDPKCMHVKNEISCVQLFTNTILQQLSSGQAMDDKRKLVQFAYVVSLLSKIKPITIYEDFQPLFEFLKF